MSGNTNIEWSDKTWNPTRGCSMAAGSECGGCLNCYAARQALRMSYHGGIYDGLVRNTASGPRWTGKVVQGDIDAPLHVRKPARWFVDSMSDLFHESVPDEWIDRAFAVMALCSQHTFQVLTKRAERMRDYMLSRAKSAAFWEVAARGIGHTFKFQSPLDGREYSLLPFPLKNVWLGVSVEDEKTARLRILSLLATPAAVRWVSYEPALGPVDFAEFLPPGGCVFLDWVVIGGESGPGARPFDLAWARNAIAQCRAAGVPCFVKQLGARPMRSDGGAGGHGRSTPYRWNDRKGADMAEWDADLRVREYPKIAG